MKIKHKKMTVVIVWGIILSMLSTSFADVAQITNIQSNSTDNQIELQWDDAEGASQYSVEVNGDDSKKVTSSSALLDGLESDTEYQIRVRGENESETGIWSDLMSIFTQKSEIAKVNNIDAHYEDNKLLIEWEASENATTYTVEINGNIVEQNIETTTLQYSLTEGENVYEIRVRGENADNVGEWSDVTAIDMSIYFLDVPVVNEKLVSNEQIEIEWEAVEGATQYEVEINGDQIITTSDLYYLHQDLDANQTYSYRVKAMNDSISSDWSEVLEVTTRLLEGLDNVTYSINGNNIKITWGTVVNATSYEIKVDGETLDVGSNTYYEHKNLKEMSEHIYQVRAKTTDGDSAWTDEIKATCGAKLLLIPSNINVEAVKDGILVNWYAVERAESYVLNINGNQVSLNQTDYIYTEGCSVVNRVDTIINNISPETSCYGY